MYISMYIPDILFSHRNDDSKKTYSEHILDELLEKARYYVYYYGAQGQKPEPVQLFILFICRNFQVLYFNLNFLLLTLT